MPNEQSAREWLMIAKHDLTAAELLFNNLHFTDTIGYILQQSLEKMLKSIAAFNNKRIKKTHDLVEIYDTTRDLISLEEGEIKDLEAATAYYVESRYPNAYFTLPTKEEIRIILDFANELFKRICDTLQIDMDGL